MWCVHIPHLTEKHSCFGVQGTHYFCIFSPDQIDGTHRKENHFTTLNWSSSFQWSDALICFLARDFCPGQNTWLHVPRTVLLAHLVGMLTTFCCHFDKREFQVPSLRGVRLCSSRCILHYFLFVKIFFSFHKLF